LVFKAGDRSAAGFRGADIVQDYEKIRDKCLANGELFEDPEFPAEDASVFFSRSGRKNFQWLRPHVSIESEDA
jgi:calpain